MSGVRRGLAPTLGGPFILFTIALEEEQPTVWAIASNYSEGRRLETWLAAEAVQERIRSALDEALRELGESE